MVFGNLEPLQCVKSVRITYSPLTSQPTFAVKQLIMQLNSETVRRRFPNLTVEWELLSYNSPPIAEWRMINGTVHREMYNYQTVDERRRTADSFWEKVNLECFAPLAAPKWGREFRTEESIIKERLVERDDKKLKKAMMMIDRVHVDRGLPLHWVQSGEEAANQRDEARQQERMEEDWGKEFEETKLWETRQQSLITHCGKDETK